MLQSLVLRFTFLLAAFSFPRRQRNTSGEMARQVIKLKVMHGIIIKIKLMPTERKIPASLNTKTKAENPIRNVKEVFRVDQLLFVQLRIKADAGY